MNHAYDSSLRFLTGTRRLFRYHSIFPQIVARRGAIVFFEFCRKIQRIFISAPDGDFLNGALAGKKHIKRAAHLPADQIFMRRFVQILPEKSCQSRNGTSGFFCKFSQRKIAFFFTNKFQKIFQSRRITEHLFPCIENLQNIETERADPVITVFPGCVIHRFPEFGKTALKPGGIRQAKNG